ncbi:MAG: Uma2 family endonuclease [Vitreimonas sp.]
MRPNVEADTSAPDLPPRQKLLTVDEFLRMGDLGLLNEEGKHELWDGRIMMTPPPGGKHMDSERRIVEALYDALTAAKLRKQFGIQTGGGLKVGEFNFRGPDVMIIRLPFDPETPLTGEGVSLVIEIASSSLLDDLHEKRGKYAGAGIGEYWVIDVRRRQLHPFRTPKAGDYPECPPLEAGATISPLFAPKIVLNVADLV